MDGLVSPSVMSLDFIRGPEHTLCLPFSLAALIAL